MPAKPPPPPEPEELTETTVIPLTPGALEVMERTQLESMMQFAIDHPRKEIQKFRQHVLSCATVDEDTAASCIYTLKRWNAEEKKTVLIQGPSIRLAEFVVAGYQNIRAGARVIDNDGRKVTAQGVCMDLENNVMMSAEVSRKITHKDGRPYSEDMQIVTAQAACAIAKRNAVFAVVPFGLIKPVYEEIKRVVTGDVSTLQVKRDKLFKRFYSMGVDKERILRVLGKESIESVDLEDLSLLVGLGTAIKDKEISIEEAFAIAPEEEEETPSTRKHNLREKLVARRAARQAERAAESGEKGEA
jgi:hypothetical protein